MPISTSEPIVFLDPAEILKKTDTLKEHERVALEEINRKVTAAESFEKIVDYIFEATKDLFPCDRIAIAFLEDHGRRVVARAARTKYNDIYPAHPTPRVCREVHFKKFCKTIEFGSLTICPRISN